MQRHSRHGSAGSSSLQLPRNGQGKQQPKQPALQHLQSDARAKRGSKEISRQARPLTEGPGVAILICASKKKLKEQVVERLAECVLTAPTTAVFNGITNAEEKIQVKLHFFGDGYEYQKEVGGRKCWVIPIMEGEYIGEEEFGIVKGVAGGNFFVMGENQMAALMGAQAAVGCDCQGPGNHHQFPRGIVASGSKVGSLKYKFMPASTNEKYCPTLREKVPDSKDSGRNQGSLRDCH